MFPPFRRRNVATAMLDELEKRAFRVSAAVGLGVGLYGDYGNAQRLYGKRGYILDGQGVTYRNEYVRPGAAVTVDDDLVLYMVKKLPLENDPGLA
ncbi:hypothetical protein ACF3MZ_10085 [Paenibacillaceae bacterium WGS1546]|uniref:hypothetical protein n=1 Tax=Cohnella sp. WGS1546 TaxID=3366810 RepID=UPI00372CEFA9